MATYDIGDVAILVADYTDRNGDPTDPSSVSLVIKRPDRKVISFRYGATTDITRSSTGHYEYRLDIAMAGTYHYRWSSTESGQSAGENSFEVRDSAVLFDHV